MSTAFRICCLLSLMLFLNGCFNSSYSARDFVTDERIDPNLTIAVLPLENLTNHPSAGVIVAQMLVTELYNQNLFTIKDETEIRNWMIQEKIDVNALTETTHAKKIAEQLGVDAVLLGSVNEYGYQHGLHEEPTVGFSVRLLRAEDAHVLWAAGHATVGRGYVGRESVSETAQKVVQRMVDALADAVGGK